MLILTRKKDESILIDGKIEIRIIELENGKVKIGIEAPKSVKILRKEIHDEIEHQNKEAAVSKPVTPDMMKTLMNKKK